MLKQAIRTAFQCNNQTQLQDDPKIQLMHSHKLPQKIESKRPYITNNNHLPYKYMLKVIILGDYGVGKSTLVNNYCKDRESIVPSELQIIASSSEVDNQSKQKQIPTLSLQSYSKYLQIDENRVKLQIWDTAGQQRFKNITEMYYKGSSGILLTYGVDNEKSFEGVERWVKEVVNKVGEGVVKILVANKVDLEDVRERDRDREKEEEKENDPNMEMKEKGDKGRRRIMREQGEALAKKYGIGYCEVSAKRNRNVNELFDGLARQILSKILAEGCTISEQQKDRNATISLDNNIFDRSFFKRKVGGGLQYTESIEQRNKIMEYYGEQDVDNNYPKLSTVRSSKLGNKHRKKCQC